MCHKCGLCCYQPFSPKEWEHILSSCRVTRKKIYGFHAGMESLHRDWKPDLMFSVAEPAVSIIRKSDLRMAREREISQEEKTKCLICLEPNADFQTPCCHHFCTSCVEKAKKHFDKKCPACNTRFVYDGIDIRKNEHLYAGFFLDY
ncbi:Oidioi.mRNA.OKI2018_I69.chr1.g2577.t1.cds [Oikopleura dioica]|uniref:Oidioi.mRNA.OKI2018_I69.chr1.g2577.t1.cds n=1 Tax=Oikopleura dioica TaxID=34765 RepID=A0ABN7SYF0_OIKDI|nr:Oidioi.mRNA.OKI2018_I69.chr1.g2577.t1.cds [Oikopleura dioica]